MMNDFVKRGHIVFALGPEPEENWKDKFKESNIEYRQFYVERNSINPFKDIKTYKALYQFIKKEKPYNIFSYQAKKVI